MDLSQLKIKARQRSPWEAVDLGFVVAREWFKPLFLVWAIPSFSLFFILTLIFWKSPWIASLVVWWLKPLFDRLPLHIASRRLFGGEMTVRKTLMSLFGLFKTQWFSSLTWRRFSPTRSHDLPITCLEQLKGKQRSRRISVMHMTSGTPAMWLTVLCVHLEMFLGLALFSLAVLFAPQNMEMEILPWMAEGNLWFQRVFNLIYVLASAVIAPFYCMGGFMLYISRRIDLEAWDLEIRFRNLVQKRVKPAMPAVVLGLVLIAGLFSMDAYKPAYAQEEEVIPREYLSLDESREIAAEVLAGEDFTRTRERKRWRLKEVEEEESELPEWLQSIFDWWESFWESIFDGSNDTGSRDSSSLGGFISGLSLMAKILLVSAAVLIAAYAIFLIMRTASKKGLFSSRKKQQTEAPEVLFGLDVRPDSLPKNVLEQVRELCVKGETQPALSLLYGALLSKLMHEYSYRFYDGHTEWECAQIVSQTASEGLKNFTLDITNVWQQLAYAELPPSVDKVESLCLDWEEVFDE